MNTHAYLELDAWDAAHAVRSRQVSAVELVDASLEHIRVVDQELNAFTVCLDAAAREQAKAIDTAIAHGHTVGPLAGVPISIKDHIWMKDAPATNGSIALRDFVAHEDSVCVARVRSSGAVIVGKTNNPEFCYRSFTDNDVWGLTRNPWRLDRVPGGSSGGASASVAAGMTPVALGTDGGGSVRMPASFCGVVGHKPTFGLVPNYPGFKGWKTLSVVGPLTRTVRDAALVMSVLAGPHSADDMTYPVAPVDFTQAVAQESRLDGLRIAYSLDCGIAKVAPDVKAAFCSAIDRFAETGATLVNARPQTDDPTKLWGLIATCEGYVSEGPLLAQWEEQMTPETSRLIRAGDRPASEYIAAMHERARYTRVWADFLEEFDLLLTPMTQVTAFPIGLEGPNEIDGAPVDPFGDWCNLCYPANLTGQPAISVPCGVDDEGMPIGLQITGRRFDDASVLRAAVAWESLAPWPQIARPASRPLEVARDVLRAASASEVR